MVFELGRNARDSFPLAAVRATLAAMNDDKMPAWASRVRALGLNGFLSALLDAAGPIAPLAGQLLYVAQPTLGLFIPRSSINQMAEWLDRPDALSELRAMLESDADADDSPHL